MRGCLGGALCAVCWVQANCDEQPFDISCLLQEWGQAQILLQEPNIETTAQIDFAANPGDLLSVKLDAVDVAAGSVQFKATEIVEAYEPAQPEQPEQAASAGS